MDQNMPRHDDTQKRLDSLPPEIKKLLYSNDVDVIVQQIGAKHRLHLDQTGLLLAEINQVMTGDLAAADFAKELMDVFRIEEEKARAIAKDVDDMLFSKIRDAMKKVYEEGRKPTPIASALEPAPASKLPPLEPRLTPPQAIPPTPVATLSPSFTPPIVPVAPIATPATPQTLPIAPKPPILATNMAQADAMLSQKTVDIASVSPKTPPSVPPLPPDYKKDPYREPTQ